MDILSSVPVEVAYQILSSLDIKEIATCQLVCRSWYWIAVDDTVWKGALFRYEEDFAIPTGSLALLHDKDWKRQCRSRILSDRNWTRGHIQSVFTLQVHQRPIVRLRLKSNKLLSADMSGQVAVWDTATFECEALLEASVGPVQLLDFSSEAMVMTVISKSGVLRIWNIKSKALIHSSASLDITCMTMDDQYLVLGGRGGQIQIVDFMTGSCVRTTEAPENETLQDIYIQNNTVIVVTCQRVRIHSIDALEVLMECLLPDLNATRTFCSVFHIRSLILLTNKHLLHLEWEALYKSPNTRFVIDKRQELPPDLSRPPRIHKTKVPPIVTITSIAIGGNHPRVLTTNADRPALNETIRVCPAPRLSRTRAAAEKTKDLVQSMEQLEIVTKESSGLVLSSPVDEVSAYLDTCGLKPSFMDVDEDVIVIGTSKGDIVVLSMLPQE